MRILIVDDEPLELDQLEWMIHSFDPSWQVRRAVDGNEALSSLKKVFFDLILLDINMPDLDGFETMRLLKEEMEPGKEVPIVLLTADDRQDQESRGLESGADDYIVKPFNPKELVARIRTRLRPAPAPEGESLRIGDLTVDVAAHEVRRDDTVIALTPLEFDLLVALARKPRQVFTREVLLEQVWGYRHAADTRLVNVHVQRLRAKVEKDPENPEVVLTVRGVGYKAGPP